MTNAWVLWLDDTAANASTVGQKAANLAHARRAGLPVLDGFCLTTDAVRFFLGSGAESDDLRRLLRRIDVSGFEILSLARQVDEMVTAIPFPAELSSAVRAAADRLARRSGLLIARSSAMAEDLQYASAAGIYATRAGLEPDSITDAVRDVIRSLFGVQALFYRKKRRTSSENASMAVLVQPQLQPDELGVMFTTDPFGDSAFLLEWSSPGVAGPVTDGSAPAQRLTDVPQAAPAWVAGLVTLGTRAAEVLGCPADMEWARSGEETILLQLRPITTACRRDRPVAFACADDDIQMREIDLRGCAGMHARWQRKHTRVRRSARRANIEVAACLYVEYGPESAGEAAAAAIAVLHTPHIFLDMTDELRSVVIARDTLADHLTMMAGQDEAVTVRIRECYTEHASLLSGVVGEDSVLIEHTPGGIKGLIRGLSAANRYVVTGTGDVHSLRTDAASDQYVFDQDLLAFSRSTRDAGTDARGGNAAPRVCDDVLRKVAEFTRQVSTAGHALRLEWCVADGAPYLLDHSVERDRETLQLGEGCVVMSPGTASGTAMVIPTLGDLEYLSDGNLVSVDSVDPAVASDHAVKSLLDRARRLSEVDSVIVIAERPATALALLVDVANAFVFEDGALLSHLAILLREAGKPAVLVPGATSLIADGSHVMIAPDGLMETSAAERSERADS